MRITPLILVIGLLMLAACGSEAGSDAATESAPDAAHTSRNSLDWTGTYEGTVPCADCPGIHTRLSLYDDGTFARVTRYVDRAGYTYVDRGGFSWDAEGRTIRLEGIEDAPDRYQVVENGVIQRDLEGQPITGELASRYRLARIPAPAELEDTRWRLIELRGASVAATDRTAWFILESAVGRAHGSLGCNGFSASYTIPDSTRVQFEGMSSTRMACLDPAADDALGPVLERMDTWQLRNDTLSLTTARMAWQARFVSE